jgi:hypothetical protein
VGRGLVLRLGLISRIWVEGRGDGPVCGGVSVLLVSVELGLSRCLDESMIGGLQSACGCVALVAWFEGSGRVACVLAAGEKHLLFLSCSSERLSRCFVVCRLWFAAFLVGVVSVLGLDCALSDLGRVCCLVESDLADGGL